jgi:hypothetical protein
MGGRPKIPSLEIDERNGEAFSVAAIALQRSVESIEHKQTVRQASQGIVIEGLGSPPECGNRQLTVAATVRTDVSLGGGSDRCVFDAVEEAQSQAGAVSRAERSQECLGPIVDEERKRRSLGVRRFNPL